MASSSTPFVHPHDRRFFSSRYPNAQDKAPGDSQWRVDGCSRRIFGLRGHRCAENRDRSQAGAHGLLQAQGQRPRQPRQAGRFVQALAHRTRGNRGISQSAAWPGDLAKEFNDRDFDVSLNLVFVDKEAHDKYQASERHIKFVEENLPNIAKVRVFDSYLSPAPRVTPTTTAK